MVAGGKRARRKHEKTGAEGGGNVPALAKVQEWETELVARNMAD